MIDVQHLSADGRRRIHAGYLARYRADQGTSVISDAHKYLPKFSEHMAQNVRRMLPSDAFNASVLASLSSTPVVLAACGSKDKSLVHRQLARR